LWKPNQEDPNKKKPIAKTQETKMTAKIEPEKGKWYYRFDQGKNFKITDVDEVRCVVKIQYLGGSTDEIEMETWDKLELQKSE
jgi:hypothetical protein